MEIEGFSLCTWIWGEIRWTRHVMHIVRVANLIPLLRDVICILVDKKPLPSCIIVSLIVSFFYENWDCSPLVNETLFNMHSNTPLYLLSALPIAVFGFPTEFSPVDPSLLFDRAIGSSCSTPVRLISLSSRSQTSL